MVITTGTPALRHSRSAAGDMYFSAKEQKIKLDTTLPDGEYADAVSGTRFSVKKSKVEGKLAPLTTYILYSI